MRYILRADASLSIGAGHVMRSSAIAEELISRGENVIFVGQITDLPWVEERIETLGFSIIHEKSSEFLSNPKTDLLILDSYHVSVDDPFLLQVNWLHIIVIVDDLTPDYRCSLRIHPGLESSWNSQSNTPVLSGPNYIPLRASLSDHRKIPSKLSHTLKIAVVAGGSDPYHLVKELAKILHTFIEPFEAYLFTNSTIDTPLDARFHFVAIGNQLDDYIKDVDLVLTTSSTSSLEFLARGLCVGVVCVVDNQQQYYKSLGEFAVAAQLGFRSLENEWELDKELIYKLVTSKRLRQFLETNANGFIDFKGAGRIVDVLSTL